MVKQTASKVPQIRFKGFDGSWENKSLGALCAIGDADHWMPETTSQGIPYVMTGDFCGVNEIDFGNAKLISEADYEELSKKIKPELGDILFARYASVGAVRLIRTPMKFIVSYSCAILKSNTSFSSPYLFYLLQSDRSQNQLKQSINTGSQGNVGIESLKQLPVTFPEKSEQTKVGEYFLELDSLIGLHQRKHDKLVALKKAMLQKMFPQAGATMPEVRFKEFSGDWEKKKLGEVGTFNPKEVLPEVFEYVDLESVVGTEMVNHRTETKKTAPSRAQRLAQQGDLFFQTVRPYQKNNHLFTLPFSNYVFSTGYAQIRPLDDGNFLLGLMQRDQFVKVVLDHCTGTSYPAINANVLAEIFVMIPSPEEQQKIGTYFRTLDELISKHAIQLQKLQQIKSACLEKMFV